MKSDSEEVLPVLGANEIPWSCSASDVRHFDDLANLVSAKAAGKFGFSLCKTASNRSDRSEASSMFLFIFETLIPL